MKRVVTVRGSSASVDYPQPYKDALKDAGIELVVISPEGGRSSAAIPADASGLLLMGGSDVNPSLYNEPPHDKTEKPDDARDALEFALLADAIARDLPVFAICRGLQILNVQQGGTLIQHLDSTALARHRRQTPENKGLPAHPIQIIPGTKLAGIAGGSLDWDVNSRHHQAIGHLGGLLVKSAIAPEDGTIEAVERPDKRFVVGVQWHPENMYNSDPHEAALFRAFANAL
jgi:gamma-glutamyl-gamma-aminobutyrate hydrolase PuuD